MKFYKTISHFVIVAGRVDDPAYSRYADAAFLSDQRNLKLTKGQTGTCQEDFLSEFKSSEYCKIVEDCDATASSLANIECQNADSSINVVQTICNEVNQCLVTESKDLCCFFFSCADVCN